MLEQECKIMNYLSIKSKTMNYLSIKKVKFHLMTQFGKSLTESQIYYIRSLDDDSGYGYDKLKAFGEILGKDLDWILKTND